MMCTVAPFALPAGLDDGGAATPRRTMAEHGGSPCPPPSLRGSGYGHGFDDDDLYEADMDALLRDMDSFVGVGHTPRAESVVSADYTGYSDRRMPSAEFLEQSWPNYDCYDDDDDDAADEFEFFYGAGTGYGPVAVAAHDEDDPTTPVAELRAPFSYGDDDGACASGVTKKASEKKRPVAEPSEAYDADIDAAFRKMEKDPAERPSEDYLWATQEGKMTMLDRAELVTWMYELSRFHDLPPGALHRAVSYVDRYLSAKKIARDLRLLGAVAVFAAAKYEDRRTSWLLINADGIARNRDVRCSSRRDVVDAERDLVSALGYRLFVDHFTRHDHLDTDEGMALRSLAHHLADMTLLDYRCVPLMPSAVAAAAILLATLVVVTDSATPQELWSEMSEMTGYNVEDLADIMDTIYEMHELTSVWQGCAQMMASCVHSYSLPPRSLADDRRAGDT